MSAPDASSTDKSETELSASASFLVAGEQFTDASITTEPDSDTQSRSETSDALKTTPRASMPPTIQSYDNIVPAERQRTREGEIDGST